MRRILMVIVALTATAAVAARGADRTGESDDFSESRKELEAFVISLEVPPAVSHALCGFIPSRIISSLTRNIWGFESWIGGVPPHLGFTQAVSPDDTAEVQWIFYVSGDARGGVLAIIEEDADSARVICSQDTLLSMERVLVETFDLTGDRVPEIVLQGKIGIGRNSGCEVVQWDGRSCVVITPLEEQEPRWSALIGSFIEYRDADSDGVLDIAVSAPQSGSTAHLKAPVSIFKYSQEQAAFIVLPAAE